MWSCRYVLNSPRETDACCRNPLLPLIKAKRKMYFLVQLQMQLLSLCFPVFQAWIYLNLDITYSYLSHQGQKHARWPVSNILPHWYERLNRAAFPPSPCDSE